MLKGSNPALILNSIVKTAGVMNGHNERTSYFYDYASIPHMPAALFDKTGVWGPGRLLGVPWNNTQRVSVANHRPIGNAQSTSAAQARQLRLNPEPLAFCSRRFVVEQAGSFGGARCLVIRHERSGTQQQVLKKPTPCMVFSQLSRGIVVG